MEISTEIKNNIRWHIVRGVIDMVKLVECLREIYNSSDFDSEMNVFWDLNEADFTSISTKEILSFKDFVGKNWGEKGTSKAALVVTKNLGFGLSRMYQIFMESKSSSKVIIFKDIDKAKEWIKAK